MRNWKGYFFRCLWKGHQRIPISKVGDRMEIVQCPHCNYTASRIISNIETISTTTTTKEQIGDRIIEFYLPSVYFENLQKANLAYQEAKKRKEQSVDEEEKKVFEKEIKSLYHKKWAKGYFRDGKDGISMLNYIGLSFDLNIKPYINKEGYIEVSKIVKIYDIIKDRFPIPDMEVYKPIGDIIEGKQDKKKNIILSYKLMTTFEKEGRKRKFLSLLKMAIDKKENIYVKYLNYE